MWAAGTIPETETGQISTSEARSLPIYAVTNSPDLLDQFTDCPECVRVMTRNPETNGNDYAPKPLDPTGPLGERIKEGWLLGDLWRTGDPLIGGWPW